MNSEHPNEANRLGRRQFLILAGALVTDLKAIEKSSFATSSAGQRVIDAGPVNTFASDGVYSTFLNQGFFVVRKGPKLQALSSFCTHRKCKLAAEPDQSFYCKCHGSTFDPTGKVTEGPAKRDLPTLPCLVNERGHLLVTVPTT
ncbi:MAG: Rieske 2Fe-2S domain-containing protein [Verrucomicrobia bacterium]|nr:Rieske 2Fe-2S domain-containing protein [Verrucomicrobiota bacterium]